jgi:site-specific DNA recombinase
MCNLPSPGHVELKKGDNSMRTALYVRVSSDRQDVDLSVAAQLKALREYAGRSGHSVVREFIDEAESGRTSYRPQFREMIATAKQTDKPFDLILVYKYSRFTRSRKTP